MPIRVHTRRKNLFSCLYVVSGENDICPPSHTKTRQKRICTPQDNVAPSVSLWIINSRTSSETRTHTRRTQTLQTLPPCATQPSLALDEHRAMVNTTLARMMAERVAAVQQRATQRDTTQTRVEGLSSYPFASAVCHGWCGTILCTECK